MSAVHYADSLPGGAWDASLLEPMAELNAEILEATVGLTVRDSDEVDPYSLRWQWRVLSESGRLRLARCPYLLVDAQFANPELWLNLPRAGVHEIAAVRAEPPRALPLATPLLRRILLFAWYLARTNGLSARIVLGMNPTCAKAIAGCRLIDLENLAEQRPLWIKTRWHDRPDIWRSWLFAAELESSRELERLQLWGLQTLAGLENSPSKP